PVALYPGEGFLCVRLGPRLVDGDRQALRRQPQGDGPADAGGGAGDQGDLVRDTHARLSKARGARNGRGGNLRFVVAARAARAHGPGGGGKNRPRKTEVAKKKGLPPAPPRGTA